MACGGDSFAVCGLSQRSRKVRRVSRIRFSPLRWACVAAVSTSICGLSSTHARPVLVDEVVAVLDLQGMGPRRSVTLSEIELSAFLLRASDQGPESLDDPLDSRELAAALSAFVDTLVVVGEADRLEVFRLDSRDVDVAVDRFLDDIGRESVLAWLKRTGRSMETVREFVLRKARVQRYLEGRFRLAARPRPAQVRELWLVRAADGHSEEYEGARPALEAQLEKERFDELVTQFVTDVRRRVRIRVLRDFSSDDLGGLMHGTVSAPQTKGVSR